MQTMKKCQRFPISMSITTHFEMHEYLFGGCLQVDASALTVVQTDLQNQHQKPSRSDISKEILRPHRNIRGKNVSISQGKHLLQRFTL